MDRLLSELRQPQRPREKGAGGPLPLLLGRRAETLGRGLLAVFIDQVSTASRKQKSLCGCAWTAAALRRPFLRSLWVKCSPWA